MQGQYSPTSDSSPVVTGNKTVLGYDLVTLVIYFVILLFACLFSSSIARRF